MGFLTNLIKAGIAAVARDSSGNITGHALGNVAVHDNLRGITSALDLRIMQLAQALPGTAAPTITETAPTAQLTGTNYYIDSVSGSDSNNGTSPTTPWQNITKLIALNPGNGAIIHLAADGVWTYADTWANYKVHSTSSFPYNCSDNIASSSSTAPIVIKPYYPRGSTSSKPTIAWYGVTQSSDWTQVTTGGNPSITLSNVWRTPWSSSLTGNGFFVLMNNGTQMATLAIQQVTGQAYGTAGNNPGQLLNYGDVAYDGSYLYICSPVNPITQFGSVWVTGAYGVFSSFWQGLSNVKFINLQFNYCLAIQLGNQSTAPITGLEIEGCTFNSAQVIQFNNANTNASPQMCSLSVHDNVINNCPYNAVKLSVGGTAGNSISWQVYRNRVYTGNLYASFGGALLYNQSVGGTYHHAWGNYISRAYNGTGGNNIDGAGIYHDVTSATNVTIGNIFEQCGIGVQCNDSLTSHVVSNFFLDCVAAVRCTGANSNNIPNQSYNIQQNSWVWTGRIATSAIYATGIGKALPSASQIAIGPGTGGMNQSVFQQWNDNFAAFGNKFTNYVLTNNLAIDAANAFANAKPFGNYLSSTITTLLVRGNASGGLGTSALLNNNGTDETKNANYLAVVGTATDASTWLENVTSGSAKLSLDSPLFGMGSPLSIQYPDIKGTTFNNIPTPGCYEQSALRLY